VTGVPLDVSLTKYLEIQSQIHSDSSNVITYTTRFIGFLMKISQIL